MVAIRADRFLRRADAVPPARSPAAELFDEYRDDAGSGSGSADRSGWGIAGAIAVECADAAAGDYTRDDAAEASCDDARGGDGSHATGDSGDAREAINAAVGVL